VDQFVVALPKVVVVSALAVLVGASFVLERRSPWRQRLFTVGFAIVLAASILAYFNFGRFRFEGGVVNRWEQYHFFLGSKYLPELRYDGLYDATVAAMFYRYHLPMGYIVRDLTTFELRPAHRSLASVEASRSRFPPERWQEFTDEAVFFFRDFDLPMKLVLRDHGNTGSPAWAAVARLFTARLSASPRSLSWLAFLDVVLLLALSVAMARIFGLRVLCISMSITLLIPRVYDFLGGSILRLDWLLALGAAACLLAVRRPKTAAVFLAYAIASKPFCALFAVSLGLWHVIAWLRRREPVRPLLELTAWTAAALVVIVALSAALLGGPSIWIDYGERIHLNLLEKYYNANYSFRDVVLQLAHGGPRAVLDWTPEEVAASLEEVQARNLAVPLSVARAALLALLVFVLARHDDELFAFGMGAFFVFAVFVTNMYYWQMLLIPAIAFARGYRADLRKTLYLLMCCLFIAVSFLYVRFGYTPHLQGFLGSWMLTVFGLAMGAVEATAAILQRRRLRSNAADAVAGEP